MSDVPQGPGWWQASDGRYYPPEQFPQQPPPPQPGQPPQQQQYPAQGYYPQQPVVVQQKSGCGTATIVVLVIVIGLFLLGVLSILAITFLGSSASSKFESVGTEIEGASASGSTQEQLASALQEEAAVGGDQIGDAAADCLAGAFIEFVGEDNAQRIVDDPDSADAVMEEALGGEDDLEASLEFLDGLAACDPELFGTPGAGP